MKEVVSLNQCLNFNKLILKKISQDLKSKAMKQDDYEGDAHKDH